MSTKAKRVPMTATATWVTALRVGGPRACARGVTEVRRVLGRNLRLDPRTRAEELDQAVPGVVHPRWRRAYLERLEEASAWSERDWITSARLVEGFLLPVLKVAQVADEVPLALEQALRALARVHHHSRRSLGDSYPAPLLLRALVDAHPSLFRAARLGPLVSAAFDVVSWGPGWARLLEREAAEPLGSELGLELALERLVRVRRHLGSSGVEVASCLLAEGFDAGLEELLEVSRALV